MSAAGNVEVVDEVAGVAKREPRPGTQSPDIGFMSKLSFAAHLDPEPYGEIARDPSCGFKVALLVAVAGLGHGIAAYSAFGPMALVVSTLGGLCFWLLLSSVIFALGRSFAPSHVPWAVVARGIGVAAFALPLVAINATGHSELLKLGVHVFVYTIATVSVVIATKEALAVPIARALPIGLLGICISVACVLLVLPIVAG